MKRKMKTALFALVFVIGSITMPSSVAKASNQVTFTKSADICTYLSLGYNKGVKGPIIITQGVMKKGSTQKEVYLVTLSGTEDVDNQSTDVTTDLLSGFKQDNGYVRNAVSAIQKGVPKNSNLILAGHSLGGMIAQQVAAESSLKTNYNILYTVTFGSPLISGSIEGTLKRLGDTSDLIPFLSIDLFQNTAQALFGISWENGGYGSDVTTAHVESYRSNRVWDRYDITGTKNGSATLTLNLDTQTFYKAPVVAA